VDDEAAETPLDAGAVRAAALASRFALVGLARADALEPGPLAAWLAAGHAADMDWMGRGLAERLDPRRVLPGAKTVIALALGYHRTGVAASPRSPVARYARGRDYHYAHRDGMKALRRRLLGLAPGVETYACVDTGVAMEKVWAARAGLGWIGKNGCLINPRWGSWLTLSVMFVDREVDAYDEPHDERCGDCTLCLRGCPTQAFPSPGVVDARRCLAYHSIENIGIILIGFGAALMFIALGHTRLAAIALIAGLYHTINHALFKGLLFLGAGSVLHATHTRDMEKMGGLIRRMPQTAFYFLVGAIAISGLPPLNGFVSEWFTYQALLAGFGTTDRLTRVIFPIAGSLLALTAALAATCFVKAFGITFLALPRSEEAEGAEECGSSMLTGMAALTAACFALGLGATAFLRVFDGITARLLNVRISADLIAGSGIALASGSPQGGTVSTVGIAALLVILSALPALLLLRWGSKGKRVTGPTWDCGLPGLTAENEYTATAFSKPLRMIFAALYQPRREIHAEFEISPYYPKAIRFDSEIEPTFEKRLYGPLKEFILALSIRLRAIQAGSIHAYLAYIFITLILLLLFGVRP